MEETEREGRSDKVAEKRKYLRIQYVGMGIFLSWPVAMQLVLYFRLGIRLEILSVLMIMVAVVVFAIGTVGRQELKGQGKR